MTWKILIGNINATTSAMQSAESAGKSVEERIRELLRQAEEYQAIGNPYARDAARLEAERLMSGRSGEGAGSRGVDELPPGIADPGRGLPPAALEALERWNPSTFMIGGRTGGGRERVDDSGGEYREAAPIAVRRASSKARSRRRSPRDVRNEGFERLMGEDDMDVNVDPVTGRINRAWYRGMVERYAKARDARQIAYVMQMWSWAKGDQFFGSLDEMARRMQL